MQPACLTCILCVYPQQSGNFQLSFHLVKFMPMRTSSVKQVMSHEMYSLVTAKHSKWCQAGLLEPKKWFLSGNHSTLLLYMCDWPVDINFWEGGLHYTSHHQETLLLCRMFKLIIDRMPRAGLHPLSTNTLPTAGWHPFSTSSTFKLDFGLWTFQLWWAAML